MTLENNNKPSLSANNVTDPGRPSLKSSSQPTPPPEEKHLKEAFYKRYGVCYSATWAVVRKIAGGITLSLRDIYNTLLVGDKKNNSK